MTTSSALHVAVCLDENYLEPARTLIESLRAHHVAGALSIWLLHDGLSPRSLDRVRTQCAGWADVHDLMVGNDLSPYFGSHAEWLPYQNKSVLYRLLLPEQLRVRGVERVLYLDCDILCVGPLTQLGQTDLGDAVLGAVRDAFTPRLSSSGGIPKFDSPYEADYFNSGVLLIDTGRWQAERVEDVALEYLRSAHGRQRFYDQDALNVACFGQWFPLQSGFNTMISDPFEEDLLNALASNRLVHFVGPHKPWHMDYFFGNRRTMYAMLRQAWRSREVPA